MIISHPSNKPLLDESTLKRLEGLCEYEKFISLSRAVEYRENVRPYINPEDKFVEYEWPKDANLIDYLIRQGDITIKNVVFRKTQRSGVAFDGQGFMYQKGRSQLQEIQL